MTDKPDRPLDDSGARPLDLSDLGGPSRKPARPGRPSGPKKPFITFFPGRNRDPFDPLEPRKSGFRRFFVKLLACIGILIVLAVIGGVILLLEFQSNLMAVSETSKKIEVTIPAGADASEIGEILQDAGAIRDARSFRIYVTFMKQGHKIKAGEQIVDASMNTSMMVKSLIEGHFKMYPVTIPEGLRMTEIAAVMAKTGLPGLADPAEFLRLCRDKAFIKGLGLETDSLEGYLFPETYSFLKNATAKQAVSDMVGRFFKVWAKYKDRAANHSLSRHQIVTLASIVEKETAKPEERPLIAGVFLNRLKKNMRLETDPTVVYGIENFNGNITKKDLQTPHPYNTYVIAGLPPGPIASPGEASIKAVLEPTDTDFLYFVSKNDGSHQFSKTLREHNIAVNQYQKAK